MHRQTIWITVSLKKIYCKTNTFGLKYIIFDNIEMEYQTYRHTMNCLIIIFKFYGPIHGSNVMSRKGEPGLNVLKDES